MPISANFTADFSSFTAAVDGATTKLVTFQGDSDKVAASLGRIEKSFSGVALIQQATLTAEAIERVGGVTKLTADELERAGTIAKDAADKMRALGMDVPANIQKIADATKSADTAWGEFTHDFNIQEAIEHPVATATEGMKALAETMGPTAVAAMGVVGALGAVGAAAFELAEKAAAAGGALNDLGERTGISVPQLSKLSNAATVAGADMNTLGDAFFKLQKGIAEDSDTVGKGLDRIGLSFAELKAAGPDQQIQMIAEALANQSDSSERAAAESEIFHDKTGQLIPTLLKLNEALAQTADIRPWTEEEAKQAEEFEMQLASMKLHAEALVITLGRELIPILSGVASGAKEAGDFITAHWTNTPWGASIHVVAEELGYLSAAFDVLRGKQDIPIDVDKALAAMGKTAQTLGTIHVPTLADAMGNLGEVEKNLDPDTRKSIEAHEKLRDAFADLANAGDGWKGTLDTIDGAVVESIAAYRDAGVSMTTLKTIYSDLTESQLNSIEKLRTARAEADKEYQKELEDAAKLEARTIDETTKLWDEYELTRIKQTGTATDIKRAELEKQYNDAAAAANRMGIVDAQYWDALEARWKQGTDALGIDWAALTNAATTQSKAGLQQIADGAARTYQEALKHVGEWSDGAIEKFRLTAEKAQQAADMFGTAWADQATAATHAVDAFATDAIGAIQAVAAASAAAELPAGSGTTEDPAEQRRRLAEEQRKRYGPGQFINLAAGAQTSAVPSFGTGGSGDFGSGTVALLHGKEAIVPFEDTGKNLQFGGIPLSSGGGVTINTTINITQPLGTPDAIARVVGDAQIASLKGQGVRLPYGA